MHSPSLSDHHNNCSVVAAVAVWRWNIYHSAYPLPGPVIHTDRYFHPCCEDIPPQCRFPKPACLVQPSLWMESLREQRTFLHLKESSFPLQSTFGHDFAPSCYNISMTQLGSLSEFPPHRQRPSNHSCTIHNRE